MYQLFDQRAAFQSAYPQYSGIDAIRQDHQYMSCVFRIIFYTANNGKISVFPIVLMASHALQPFIAVMIRDHKSIVSQRSIKRSANSATETLNQWILPWYDNVNQISNLSPYHCIVYKSLLFPNFHNIIVFLFFKKNNVETVKKSCKLCKKTSIPNKICRQTPTLLSFGMDSKNCSFHMQNS